MDCRPYFCLPVCRHGFDFYGMDLNEADKNHFIAVFRNGYIMKDSVY